MVFLSCFSLRKNVTELLSSSPKRSLKALDGMELVEDVVRP